MDNEQKIIHGENKRAHLAMIQGVIDRMGGNLFYLKGWAITLLAGLFAVSTSNILTPNKWPSLLFFVLLVLFWALDGYFLSLERCFRDLYDKIRKLDEDQIDFSMDISEFIRLRSRAPFVTMFRPTLLWFYGILIISMIIIIKLT